MAQVREHRQRALAADVELERAALAHRADPGGDELDRAAEPGPVDRLRLGAPPHHERRAAIGAQREHVALVAPIRQQRLELPGVHRALDVHDDEDLQQLRRHVLV